MRLEQRMQFLWEHDVTSCSVVQQAVEEVKSIYTKEGWKVPRKCTSVHHTAALCMAHCLLWRDIMLLWWWFGQFFCHSFLSMDFCNSYKTNESNRQSIIFHKAQWSLKVWREKKCNKKRTGIYRSIGTKLNSCITNTNIASDVPSGLLFFWPLPSNFRQRRHQPLCAPSSTMLGMVWCQVHYTVFSHCCSLFDSLRTFSKSWKKITSDVVHLGPVKGNIFMKWETGSLKDVYYSTLH